ncbi:MAG TPA: adenosylmethionine--8-amino-7-oxononanoate transaminase [Xanthobacteraceae bacterium]|jgi:adenosylmethionine-8-amino-7-oxononanoate aminotransferase|nr:adenosylmethionine--8-amino-7-oxononanoate transaminase [Xanthobacteraceae bacterium]
MQRVSDPSRNPKTPASPQWQDAARDRLWLPYTQMRTAQPLAVARTEGTRIHLADGRVLIDGIASWWTACHGYNHPHIVSAITRQAALMPHVMLGGLVHEPAARLASRLATLLPGDLDHVFFSDSGSVAVEVAMKMAMQYFINRGERGRTKFITFKGGYHGDTSGAMSVCDPQSGMHDLFHGLLPEQFVASLPVDEQSEQALDTLLQEKAASSAAIIVEPLVQGAGGMRFHAPQVLKKLRALADRYGLLLIFDEIFTGFGRTGKMFASVEADVVPDIICLSKALTGGTLPLAATVARRHVFDAFLSDTRATALMHGPTFMGNALACAAANASLDLFESEPRLEQVDRLSGWMRAGLEPCRTLPRVVDVRVRGGIGVVELERIDDLEGLRARFLAEGVFVRPFGRTVYLTPAFTIAEDDVAILMKTIARVLATPQ